MKISLNWLKRYIDIEPEVEGLVDTFTSLGFEVESVESTGLMRQSSLVVGEIQKIEQHPNADKLSVCQVCVGVNDSRQIVCGAKNFKLFDHVPVALPGTILPRDIKITESTLRGIPSKGMMCSGRELGIGEDHSGLLILDKLTTIGAVLHDVIDIENDTIFDLSVTSNRGDCLSYLGIARELGCKLNLPVKFPAHGSPIPEKRTDLVADVVVQSDDCSGYYGFCLAGVKVGPSPEWIARDLQASGIKSINNVVDICNWVMLETGNPLYAFDVAKIKGNTLTIRHASNNESILGLDNRVHELNERVTVIADNERPLVIAGIIGSKDAEIDSSSTDILIESACFNSAAIMRASRMLNIFTDSSYRFARTVDGASCKSAGERALNLIVELCGGRYVQYSPAREYRAVSKTIIITDEFISNKLGFSIDHEIIHNILERLGFEVRDDGIGFTVIVPNFRSDIESPIDIVEECLRVYGTDKIPYGPVVSKSTHRKDHKAFTFSAAVRQMLSEHGFYECYNYSLISSEVVHNLLGEEPFVNIANPLSADQACYRQSLLPGLLNTLRTNIQNGNLDSRFFEIGKIATKTNDKINEYLAVSFVISEEPLSRTINPKNITFTDVKRWCFGVVKHCAAPEQVKLQTIQNSTLWQPGYSAEYVQLARSGIEVRVGLLNKRSLKQMFDIKENIFGAEIIISDTVFGRKSAIKSYSPFSQFPRVVKDISVIVDHDEQSGEVKHVLEKIAKKSVNGSVNIEHISLFDVYTGERINHNKKALGFEISFRSNEKTLTDNEVQKSFDYIQNEITKFYEIRKIS